MKSLKIVAFQRVMANTLDAFIPEIWSKESLAILEENMVPSNLIRRDFEDKLANFGDTVKVRRPSELVAVRKTNDDDVTVQDVSATEVDVKLDQHVHVSFLIKDGEESKSFQDLVSTYLRPSMLAQARLLDQIVIGQYVQFLGNVGGHLGGMSSSTAKDYLLETRQVMTENKAYNAGRHMVLTPSTETEMLKLDLFISAEKVGDDGTALREASLGRKLGFDFFVCQNAPTILDNSMTKKTGAINLTAGYAAGTTSLVVDGFSGAVADGAYLTIAGDDTVLQVASHTETLSNTTGIVLVSGLKRAVADNAVIKVYTAGAVNNSGGYAAGYAKEITVDGFTAAPQAGQLISFGTQTSKYAVVTSQNGPSTTKIQLDRPLVTAITDDLAVNVGPPGQYNFTFLKDCLALVVRPLALPRTGAIAGSSTYNGLSMRTVITYNGTKQGHLVTLDMLCGITKLDDNLAAVNLG